MQDFLTTIQPLLGLTAWNPRKGVGSFLRIEFGEKIEKTVEATAWREKHTHEFGEWSLWIYWCQWRIERNGTIIASSQSEKDDTLRAAARTLNGRALESIQVSEPMWDTAFHFSDGHTLRTFSTDVEKDYWLLRIPSGKYLVASADKDWTLQK